MAVFLAIITYFAYLFIIGMYTRKAVKYLKLPVHLRWELYPVMHEERYSYGGSYFEHMDWQSKGRRKNLFRGIIYLLRGYLFMGDYFKRNRSYWLALYPWHVGFILIIAFHILCFFGAVAMLLGLPISPHAPPIGEAFYYLILLTGVVSFVAGAIGSVGVFIKRVADEGLRLYASPQNFVTYVFCLAVFLSGLYAWYFVDPTLSEYREFWKGLITFHPTGVATAASVHIMLFDLFLIYLPFTRSMHYITRIFAFFLIRWDDEPNVRGSALERKLLKLFDQKVSWAAPHVGAGRTWKQVVSPPDGT